MRVILDSPRRTHTHTHTALKPSLSERRFGCLIGVRGHIQHFVVLRSRRRANDRVQSQNTLKFIQENSESFTVLHFFLSVSVVV